MSPKNLILNLSRSSLRHLGLAQVGKFMWYPSLRLGVCLVFWSNVLRPRRFLGRAFLQISCWTRKSDTAVGDDLGQYSVDVDAGVTEERHNLR